MACVFITYDSTSTGRRAPPTPANRGNRLLTFAACLSSAVLEVVAMSVLSVAAVAAATSAADLPWLVFNLIPSKQEYVQNRFARLQY